KAQRKAPIHPESRHISAERAGNDERCPRMDDDDARVRRHPPRSNVQHAAMPLNRRMDDNDPPTPAPLTPRSNSNTTQSSMGSLNTTTTHPRPPLGAPAMPEPRTAATSANPRRTHPRSLAHHSRHASPTAHIATSPPQKRTQRRRTAARTPAHHDAHAGPTKPHARPTDPSQQHKHHAEQRRYPPEQRSMPTPTTLTPH
ncbi:hypothetical protein DXG01_012650, partial [Tephrocybe rancida]